MYIDVYFFLGGGGGGGYKEKGVGGENFGVD
jgi:hypothetical protein